MVVSVMTEAPVRRSEEEAGLVCDAQCGEEEEGEEVEGECAEDEEEREEVEAEREEHKEDRLRLSAVSVSTRPTAPSKLACHTTKEHHCTYHLN